jgi:hypothetical protein
MKKEDRGGQEGVGRIVEIIQRKSEPYNYRVDTHEVTAGCGRNVPVSQSTALQCMATNAAFFRLKWGGKNTHWNYQLGWRATINTVRGTYYAIWPVPI